MFLYIESEYSRYYERGYNPIAKLSEIIDSYSKRYTNTAPTHRIDKDIQSKIETGYPGKSQCTEIGYWRPNSYLTVHRTAIHFLGKYNGSLKTNIPNVGCLVIVRMDLLNKYPRGPITFHPGIDNMSTWPQKCLLSTSSNSY